MSVYFHFFFWLANVFFGNLKTITLKIFPNYGELYEKIRMTGDRQSPRGVYRMDGSWTRVVNVTMFVCHFVDPDLGVEKERAME